MSLEGEMILLSINELEVLAGQFAETDPATAISVMEEICSKAEDKEDFEAALAWYEKIVELASVKGFLFDAARAHFNAGLLFRFLEKVDAAVSSYSLAAEGFAQEGQERHMLDALMESCETLANALQWERLIPIAEEARRIANIEEEFNLAGRACAFLSNAYFESVPALGVALDNDEYFIALEYAVEAENHFKNSGDVIRMVKILVEKSSILGFLDREPEDLEALKEAEELLKDVPDVEQNWHIYKNVFLALGQCYERAKENLSGIDAYEKAKIYFEKLGVLENDSQPHLYLAYCQTQAEEYQNALQNFEKARDIALKNDNRWYFYRAEFGIADVLGDLEKHSEVIEKCELAIQNWKIDNEFIGANLVIFTNLLTFSLNQLGRFQETLERLKTISEIDDYFLTLEEALVFELRAGEALIGLEKLSEANEKLNLVIERLPKPYSDYTRQLAAEAYELRGRANFDFNREASLLDLGKAVSEYLLSSKESAASKIVEEFKLVL